MTPAYAGWYDGSIHRSWAAYASAVRWISGARPSPEFARDGYVVGTLPDEPVRACIEMIARSQQIAMQADDSAPGFRRSEKVHKVAKALNAGHHYYRPDALALEPLRRLIEVLAKPVREALGCEWRIINTRIVETLPSAEAMGPNTWHGDGFPPAILKVMIYLSSPGRESGTTELQLPGGASKVIEGPPGTWLVFRNSEIIHRGIPPASAPRLAIELTLTPSLRRNLTPIFAGLNATYPEHPWSLHPVVRALALALRSSESIAAPSSPSSPSAPVALGDKAVHRAEKEARAADKQGHAREKEARARAKQTLAAEELRRRRRQQRAVRLLNRVIPPLALNIGGGPEFVHLRWVNLDGAPGPANPSPFRFVPGCLFPLRDRSVHTVYTSHCLEHLDDATVEQVLREARRVLKPGGRLVVKIPDFDRALACWRAGDDSFFDADRWGLRRLTTLWPRRGIEDSLDARASMVFCGFWNDEYGDHFGDRQDHERAYHGPAVVGQGFIRDLLCAATPHEISAALRREVLQQEKSYHFNHQNAWSRAELAHELECAGFEVASFESDEVIAAASDVPGIVNARPESLYCLARILRS